MLMGSTEFSFIDISGCQYIDIIYFFDSGDANHSKVLHQLS